MIKPILFLLVCLLCSCSGSKKISHEHAEKRNMQNDTLYYKKVSNVFYKGSDGKMYIQTQSLRRPPEEYGPVFYREVPVADVKSYISLSGGYYAKDRFHVYRYWGTTDGSFIAIIEEADAKTFSVISFQLGRDKNHVFYAGNMVKEIDVNSLVILCNNPHPDFSSSYGLIRDDKSVFYYQRKMETIDVASFECICKDSVIVYQDKDWIYDDEYFPGMNPEKRTRRN